jgi:hypothetical protein
MDELTPPTANIPSAFLQNEALVTRPPKSMSTERSIRTELIPHGRNDLHNLAAPFMPSAQEFESKT